MSLTPVTIRFSPETIDLVNRAAHEMQMSVAQFVRGAAAARALIVLNEGAGRRAHDAVADLMEHPEVERLSRVR